MAQFYKIKGLWLLAFSFALMMLITSSCGEDSPTNGGDDDPKIDEKLIITPLKIDFGDVVRNDSAYANVYIQSTYLSAHDLRFLWEGVDAKYFRKTETAANRKIQPQTTDTLTIVFEPDSIKLHKAGFNINFDLFIVQLEGRGVHELKILNKPDTMNFCLTKTGKSIVKTITVQNISKQPYEMNAEVLEDPDNVFSLSQTNKTLQPQETTDIDITFSPTDGKTYEKVFALDTDTIVQFKIIGKGTIDDAVSLENNTLDFGTVNLGESKTLEAMVMNEACTDATITGITFPDPDFSGNLVLPYNLAGESQVSFNVMFEPTKSSDVNAQAIIEFESGTQLPLTLKAIGHEPPKDSKVISAKVSNSPVIDGNDNDGAWAAAQELQLNLIQLESTQPGNMTYSASIKSVNDGTNIYFLVKVMDDTRDEVPNRIVYNGGDYNSGESWAIQDDGQDGISFAFPITGNVSGDNGRTFAQDGCLTSCHITENFLNYESGFYPSKGKIDVWYWKAGTTNPQGFADDYHAMGNDDANPDFWNQRRGDIPGNVFTIPNFSPDGIDNKPVSVAGGDNNGLDKSKFLWMDTQENLDANNPATGSSWSKGDQVPGWKLRLQQSFFSSRGDITAKGKYSNGYWVVEFMRPMDTESDGNDDIIFGPGTSIPFGFSYHDDAKKYSEPEYLNLDYAPRPSHHGPENGVITLEIK